MSLGDYEHTFRVVLTVSVRSKSPAPGILDTPDVDMLNGYDGVEATVDQVEHVSTNDLLPPDVRKRLEES